MALHAKPVEEHNMADSRRGRRQIRDGRDERRGLQAVNVEVRPAFFRPRGDHHANGPPQDPAVVFKSQLEGAGAAAASRQPGARQGFQGPCPVSGAGGRLRHHSPIFGCHDDKFSRIQ
jgi:hypothetical protein